MTEYLNIHRIALKFNESPEKNSFLITQSQKEKKGIFLAGTSVFNVDFSYSTDRKTFEICPKNKEPVSICFNFVVKPYEISLYDDSDNEVKSFTYSHQELTLQITNNSIVIEEDSKNKSAEKTNNTDPFESFFNNKQAEKTNSSDPSKKKPVPNPGFSSDLEKKLRAEFEEEKKGLIKKYEDQIKENALRFEEEKQELIKKHKAQIEENALRFEEEKQELTQKYDDQIKENASEFKKENQKYFDEYVKIKELPHYNEILELQRIFIKYNIELAEFFSVYNIEELKERNIIKKNRVEEIKKDAEGLANSNCNGIDSNLICEYIEKCIEELRFDGLKKMLKNRKKD